MPISFRQWISSIRRHWLLSSVAFIAVMGLTVAVILMAPRSYSSEAKVMMRIGRESVTIDPTAGTVGDQLSLHHTRENEILSAVGIMQSREILERVVNEVGEEAILEGVLPGSEPESSPSKLKQMVGSIAGSVGGWLSEIDPIPDSERAIRQLQSGVHIETTDQSSVVSIFYSTKSAEVAQTVVDEWLHSFIAQHAKANHTDGSLQFFIEQGGKLRDRLDQSRVALEEVKSESNLVTIDGQQKLLEAQLTRVRDALLDTGGELAATKSRLSAYDEILENSDQMMTTAVTDKANEGRDMMRAQLFALEVTARDLESKYHDDHPKLIAARNQLADAKKIYEEQEDSREEVTQSVNPTHQEITAKRLMAQADMEALAQKQSTLLDQQKTLSSDFAALNEAERKIRTLESEVQILENRYVDHATKMEQARMDEVLSNEEITSVSIVQPATLQMRPVSPNKPLCAVAGFLAAAVLALSLPVLLDTRSDFNSSKSSSLATTDDWEFEKRERLNSQDQEPADPVTNVSHAPDREAVS